MGSKIASLYSRFTRVLAAIVGFFCAFLAVNLLMTGTPSAVGHFLPGLLLVAWLVYMAMWRPALLVFTKGVRVNNILRDHVVPYTALKGVSVLASVSVTTDVGRIPSWGAPGTGKRGPALGKGFDTSATSGASAMPQTQAIIEKAWEAWEDAEAQAAHTASESALTSCTTPAVTSCWNVANIVVLAVLLVATVIGFFL